MTRTRSQASRYAVAKGKDYERRIARILSEWWGSCLHRTPTSGVNIYSGDIVDDKGRFPFIVECKKNEEWSLFNLLSPASPLQKFWAQALDNYIEGDPHHAPGDPCLLVFSKRSVKDYFLIGMWTFIELEKYCGQYPSHAIIGGWRSMSDRVTLGRVVVGRLAEFLDHFDSDMIKTIPELPRR